MAGSRLERIGTIFSRTTGLLKSGAIKYQDRPVWYDIYRVFPPKFEPYVERTPSRAVEEIPAILYKEDKVRAKFYKEFGHNPDSSPRKFTDHTFEDPSQPFVQRFNELEKANPDWSQDDIFQAAAEEYQVTRPQRPRGRRGDHATSVYGSASGDLNADILEYQNASQDDESVSSELLGGDRSRRARKMPLVTPESLRSLFEDAKSDQSKAKDKNDSEKS